MNKEEGRDESSHKQHPFTYRIILYIFVVATLIITFQAARDVPALFDWNMYETSVTFIVNILILFLLAIGSWYALFKMNKAKQISWGYFFLIPLVYVAYSLIQLISTLQNAQLLDNLTNLFAFNRFFIYGIPLVLYVIGLILLWKQLQQNKKR